jgi:heme-degrading monooxygenase HmoA
MSLFATTPEPPYYAVIFTAAQSHDLAGYGETVARIKALAAAQPGFLGVESVETGGEEITVSYWRDLQSVTAWKRQADHIAAQAVGRERWYAAYAVRVAKVERAYDFSADGLA